MDRLIRDIKSVGDYGEIKIFSGEGNCHVYNNSEVYDALKEAKDRGVKIRMIIGPIISVAEETGETYLSELAGEGIEVFFRPCRHTLLHYRVMKDSEKIECYVEDHHPPMERGEFLISDKNGIWAQKFDSDFDQFIEAYGLKHSENLMEFVPLRPSEIELLKKKSRELNKSLDYLKKEDIVDILKL